MNWVIKFNQLERENTDKVIDIVAKVEKYQEDILDEVFTKAYQLNHSVNNLIDKLNANVIVGEELRVEVEGLIKTHIEMQEEYNKKNSEIIKYVYVCGCEVVELKNNIFESAARYVRTRKDFDMLSRRVDVFSIRMVNMAYSLDMGVIDDGGIFAEVYNNIKSIKKIIEKKNNEFDEKEKLIEQLKQKQKKDYLKIFDYKEMIDLAEKNEYKQIRQTGDHIIMQHKKSNKIVPIPAHELKYGLMLQIQKQIEVNKIC